MTQERATTFLAVLLQPALREQEMIPRVGVPASDLSIRTTRELITILVAAPSPCLKEGAFPENLSL